MTQPETELPLAGLRVVEFTHMVMGPAVGVILADLGADVVKVEPPGGDNTRRLTGSGAGYFAMYNRNKRSLCLDTKSAAGRDVAQRLCARADVVIENFRPGAMDKLGLGYAALAQRNPRLIYCSLKGFLAGPYQHRTALDEVTQMMGGLAYMTGLPGKPMRAGASVIDVTGGMFGVDGQQLFVAVVSDTQWRQFCEAFGFATFAADRGLDTNAARVARRAEIIPQIRARFAGMTKPALMAALEHSGLPFAPIARPEDLFDDPQLQGGGLVAVTLADGRRTRLPAMPVAFGEQRLGLRRDLPLAGEHSADVLDELGLGPEEQQRLVANGVVQK